MPLMSFTLVLTYFSNSCETSLITIFYFFRKGVKSYSISYISKYQTLPARFSVNTSHENNLALSFFPSKNGSPKVPASKTNNSHQARSREATPERLKTLQNMCSPKGLSSLPGNLDGKDEVLLKELADLIEDIQDSDENSDMDEDNVFVSDPFSPNVISTPYSSKNISIRGIGLDCLNVLFYY